MSKVAVTKDKLDYLANAISLKSGESLTLTIDDMIEAVDGIETGGSAPNLQSKIYTVDSAGTETITADSGYDGLSSVSVSVPEGDVSVSATMQFYTENNVKKWRYRGTASIESGDDYGAEGYIDDHTFFYGDWIIHNAVAANTTITPTESSQTIGGGNYMMEGAVTVGAISSSYVGSGITRRDSTDLSASGATVTVPSGYYESNASKSVSSGTEGTPTATKGTVSNHSISVTPSVTNSAGYISGGTKTGTAVSVSASELVSGTYSVTSSGTKDVTNYASASVASGSATASATKGTVSNHSVTVTPSVTRTAGYITAGSANGTAVTVSASELVSGSETKTANGTYDVTNLAELVVNVASGSSKNVQVLQSTSRTSSSSLTKVLGDLTVSKTGTYDVYWSGGRTNTSTSYTWGTRLYVDGSGYGTENTTWTNNCQSNHLSNVSLTVNQKLSVYARGRTGSYYTFAPMLVIIEA